MVFDGFGPLVKRCDGFDGSLWSSDKYINTLMCRLRVGRTYLNADSFKIGHSETDRCECGKKETVAHFFVCERFKSQQDELKNKCNSLIQPPYREL